MKGSKTRSLLHWVFFIVFVFLAIHRLKGSASHPPTVSPPKDEAAPPSSITPDSRPRITEEEPLDSLQLSALPLTPVPPSLRRFPLNSLSIQPSFAGPAPSTQSAQNISFHSPATSPALIAIPVNHGQTYGVPVAAPAKEVSIHLYPVNHSHGRGLSPAIAPASAEVKKTSNTSQAPTVSLSHPLRSSPTMSPMPLEGKQPSNVADAPLPSHLQPSLSPHVRNEPSVPPLPSHLRPSESSPAISPAPKEVNNPSNASHPQPSGSSPAISPTPHEVKDPSNITDSPLPSSPPPHEVKEPSITTHSPLPSHPFPLKSSPLISHVPHEVMDPSHSAHSPLASHPKSSGLSPVTSPVPHVVKEPSNTTHSPLPLESSPAISPAPPKVIVSANNTHGPLASHPKLSGPSPEISRTQPVVKEPSNFTHSPFPSHPFPSESPPVISPSPQVVEDSSNVTHAPLPSDPKHSRISPMISPSPPEVNPSNITHSHSPSHPLPLGFSPVPAPPHEANDPSNITHAPLASHPMPSQSTPAMSPTLHESKYPSNDTLSPLPSHPLPSQSSPMMSPTPHEREPSNITHSPLPSRPHPSEHSPAVSRMPHGVKNQSNETESPLASHRHPSVSSPLLSPMPHEVKNPSNITHSPMPSHPHPPSERIIQTPSVAPTISAPHPGASIRVGSPSFAPFSPSQPSSQNSGPIISPAPSRISAVSSSNKQRSGPSPHIPALSISPIRPPFPSENREIAHAPSSSVIPSRHNRWPIHPPIIPPGFSRKRRAPPPQPFWAFPPPPPNLDCKPLSCKDPLTYPPPGSLCVCVLPIKVGLRLRIALYTFFPLVSELAQEIASGIFMKQSQVRVMGANAVSEDSEKTIVLIDLVPFGGYFDMNTAFLVYDRFWHKQVLIKASYFGHYDVLYVLYPGLPPSPPMAPGESVDGGTLANAENARRMKPLGVDVGKREEKLSGSRIVIVILSSVMASVTSIGAAWLLLLKCRNRSGQLPLTSQQPVLPLAKPSGGWGAGSGAATLGNGPRSTSASFTSSIAAHTGSAKTFSLAEVERATDRFHDSRVIGEGGFGRVYQGTFEDGTMVAVKVLKRNDHQGGREFLAEVEMLSRLHHRNLVKLIGICTEENVRCLVYELIPNGSVESHLHGLDKETSPLDWNARMKIALGAARGLAYLHEDSSPRVIHRDFKSSNILLEHDFTPKVSDFGLARTALGEGNDHISTRVMGTFGYVAPEYAMTGHLLVKSDVYSYGVVLLELLTGRKPIDMSELPGQENLVSWARPLLTSMDGLETLIDPVLSASISLDTVAKVAAIASMCVQPEVSHRPFMGEVVQALKLVCNESDEHRRSCSQDESSTKDSEIRISTRSSPEERVLSESDIFCTSATFANDASGSFRRYSSSGPLKAGRSHMLWETARGFSSRSMAERGVAHRYNEEHWP